jgi:hypothetical protein
VDNLKLIKLLPSLSPTPKVKRTAYRGSNHQQTPFKETFKQKREKKDDSERVSEQATVSESENAAGTKHDKRSATENNAAKRGNPFGSLRNRIIDIRV